MSPDLGHWIAGFVAGEAHFSLNVTTHTKDQCFNFTPGFKIKLRGDDAGALLLIKEALGCGTLWTAPPYQNTKEAVVYAVLKINDLHDVVVPFFTTYQLRAKKQDEFLIWAEGIQVAHAAHNRPLRTRIGLRGAYRWEPEEIARLKSLHAQLRECRAFRKDRCLASQGRPQ